MRIHREGFGIVSRTLVIVLAINVLMFLFFNPGPVLTWLLPSLSALFFLFILWFFRIPTRNFSPDDNLVFSPADGKVVVIEETEENEYFKDKRVQVSIFMSPLNVHVNTFPVGGIVRYSKYHPGKYLVAWHPKSSEINERYTVVLENQRVALLVRQIAGALARRIVCYASEGDLVKQGDELGFIKFGSRVDLFLPKDAKIEVELGQSVYANSTVIASLA